MNEYIANYAYTKSISSIGESSSVSTRIGESKIAATAYENIIVWDVDTLSIQESVSYIGLSVVTAIACVSEEDMQFMVGHSDGTVKCIDRQGRELFGFREHIKKIIGIYCSSDIAVVYTTSAFTVFDLRTESVLCTISIDIPISVGRVIGDKIYMGTIQGIVHIYNISDLFNRIEEATMVHLSGNQILDFLVAGALYAVLPECITDLQTKAEIPLNHRASLHSCTDSLLFTKDTKGKYHWLSVSQGVITERGQFKNTRPPTSIQVFKNKAVVLFADNGLLVYRGNEYMTSIEGGRENLLAVVENSGSILGITETEGKVFASAPETDEIDTHPMATLLFEDQGMTCISVHNGKYYIGKKDGNMCIRNKEGEEIESIKISDEPISSVDLNDQLIAVSTESRVVLLERNLNKAGAADLESFEKDELEYEDEVICVRISQDSTLIFASLADNTVKVHKVDGTKVLSLYGHSVPVVDMCMCSEKDLLYTLGGDKLIKVWGLRHGECRKTLNPIDPSGIFLKNNLLLVSTGYGMIYYLKDTFEKVKKIEYMTGKARAVPGQRRIALLDRHLLIIRERALSLFTEGDYSTTIAEQRSLEEREAETKEIAKSKKIYKIDAIEELESALEGNDPQYIYNALKRLSKTDIEKSIDIMNGEIQEKLLWALSKIPTDDNPIIFAWALGRLLQKTPCTEVLSETLQKLRAELRKQARLAMSNRAAIMWSIKQ
ncbi:hypothetical protein NEPAR06_1319 [Nematocida parisii]|eukprot:XP_013060021.1 hypothetical protein NEPG_02194 [Nematocida parisii ERTm1]